MAPKHRSFCASLIALAVLAAPQLALGDQFDGRLAPLFDQLHTVPDGAEAAAVEQQIWQIWLEADDTASDQLMRRGVAAMARGDYPVALASFDHLIELAPRFAEAWNKRATIHYLLGRFDRSVADIQQTLRLEPRHFGALSGLGLIYDALEQPAAALRSFEAALAINPHLEGARNRAVELREQVGGRPT